MTTKNAPKAKDPKRPSVVVLGGGTGTFTVLSGLKKYPVDLTAIVAMSDNGGSTGRLRDEFGYLPVGDVRMALAALSDDGTAHQELIRELFLYRFNKGEGLKGHNFGNLLLIALSDILGSEEEAIRAAAKVLRIRGTVLPVTTTHVDLVATYDDGVTVKGETHIDEPEPERDRHRITEVCIEPCGELSDGARDAVLGADLVVMGPGDLYTSVIASLLARGMQEALSESTARCVYITNLMSKFGQTSDMTISEHVREVARYAGRMPEHVLINTTPLPQDLLHRYAEVGEYPLPDDADALSSAIVRGDFLADDAVVTAEGDVLRRSLIRHDSDKLAQALTELL